MKSFLMIIEVYLMFSNGFFPDMIVMCLLTLIKGLDLDF